MTAPDFSDIPVRFSHLKAYGRSPAHGYHSRISEWKPTQAMERGRMVHGLIADEGKFIAFPGKVRQGEKYKAFCEEHPGAEVLNKTDYDLAKAMAEAIRSDERTAPLLDGIQEQTLHFNWNGLVCRATPDVRNEKKRFITELKCTGDASEWFWRFHFRKMGYHAQMWMQGLGCEHPVEHFYIVVVEDKPPHVVQIYELQESALEEGAKLLMLWSEKLKTCEASGVWPGYSQAIVPLEVPEDVELTFDEDESDGGAESEPTILAAG